MVQLQYKVRSRLKRSRCVFLCASLSRRFVLACAFVVRDVQRLSNPRGRGGHQGRGRGGLEGGARGAAGSAQQARYEARGERGTEAEVGF